MRIRELLPNDWSSVRKIYAQGIATRPATLETSPPEWEGWDRSHLTDLRYVAVSDRGQLVGWVLKQYERFLAIKNEIFTDIASKRRS